MTKEILVKETPKDDSIIISGGDDLIKQFQLQRDKNEVVEVLKELFDSKKINLITDLTHDEIKLITKIRMIADMKHLDSWTKGLDYYTSLLLSKNRKSRAELIDAIKGYNERISGLRKLLPQNWGRP